MNLKLIAYLILMIPGLSFGDESDGYRVLECPISVVGKKLIGPTQEGELWAFLNEWNIILVAPDAMKGETILTVSFEGGFKDGMPPDLLHAWVVISKGLVGIVTTECYNPSVPVSLALLERDHRGWVQKMRVELTADYVKKPKEKDRFELKYDGLKKKFEVTSRDYCGKIKFIKKVDLNGTVEEIGAVEK